MAHNAGHLRASTLAKTGTAHTRTKPSDWAGLGKNVAKAVISLKTTFKWSGQTESQRSPLHGFINPFI